MASRTALRLLKQPLQGAALWGGAGVGAGMTLPSILSNYGLIYSSSLMTTTACGGAIAILLPLGLTRGVLSSLQMALIEEDQVQKAVERLVKETAGLSPSIALQNNPKRLWETITFGSGWQGQILRTLASPFLPSTAQMLTRMQQSVDTGDSKVIPAAAHGFVEGFLQDKKDTLTMFGLVGYAVILGVGMGIDYSYRRVDQSKKAVADAARKKKDAAVQIYEATKQKMKDVAPEMLKKKRGEEVDEEAEQTVAEDDQIGAKATANNRLQEETQKMKGSPKIYLLEKKQKVKEALGKWQSGVRRRKEGKEDQQTPDNGEEK